MNADALHIVPNSVRRLARKTDPLSEKVAERASARRLEVVHVTESEERLRLALEAGRMGTWEWNPRDDRIVWEVPPEEIPGARPWRGARADFLQLLHAEDRPKAACALDRSAAGTADLEVEVRLAGGGDATRWILVSGRMIADSGGAAALLVGLTIDITATRIAQERSARAEKLRALGQLAAGVAHDLNQSLALIGGYGELAIQALAGPVPDMDTVAECVSIIRHAAIGSGQTVRQLLTFARSQDTGPAQPVDISGLLHDVATLTAPHWRDVPESEGRPIQLLVSQVHTDGPLTALGWTASLHDALTNLVFNAVDALPHGGDIRLSCRRVPEGIEIEVADNGLGMTDDVRARVFEPFFTTRGERGTGLGLARVQEIVRRHDGEISIISAPGQGTTCRLVLPAATARLVALHPPGPSSSQSVHQLRILIVEDLPALATLLAQMIRHRGHIAITAGSGEEAITWLERSTFDLVISDLGLGAGMNGWALAAHVQSRWPGVHVGLATGWGASIDPLEARDRGIMGVLPKPYTLNDLLRFLEPVEQLIDDDVTGTDLS